MKMCDPLRSSRRASLPSLGSTTVTLWFRSAGHERAACGRELVSRCPLSRHESVEVVGSPRFLENPLCLCPVLRPRQTNVPGHYSTLTRPPRIVLRRLTQVVISGLNRTASTLAVYASSGASRHATQDSLPAAGQALPDGIGYPQGSYERFQITRPPFPSFPGANDVPFFGSVLAAVLITGSDLQSPDSRCATLI